MNRACLSNFPEAMTTTPANLTAETVAVVDGRLKIVARDHQFEATDFNITIHSDSTSKLFALNRTRPIYVHQIFSGPMMNSNGNDPQLTAKIVSKYVSHHRVAASQLPELINTVHQAMGQLRTPSEGGLAEAGR